MYHIVSQLWTKVIIRSDYKSDDTCLMVDDTDFPKTGRRMENIGRVHSHLEHRSILGFKALFSALPMVSARCSSTLPSSEKKAGRATME